MTMCSMSRSEPPGGSLERGGERPAQAGGQHRRPGGHPGQRGGAGEQAAPGEFGPGRGRRRRDVRGAIGGGGPASPRLAAPDQVPAEAGDGQGEQAPAGDQKGRRPARRNRRAGDGRAGHLGELDDPVVPGVGHPDRPGRGDRQALRELQVLGGPARVRLQAELGVEAPGRAEHGHQPVVRLRDVDPAVRPDRDAARVAEVTVARLGGAERAQLMPGRGELAHRVTPGQGVGGAGHPDLAAGVQPDAGRRRHGERDAVAAVGGELHHPAVALVGDPDVAGGRDRERHRLVQPLPAAPGRAESGQHPAGGGELHHPAMAGVRHPDVPGRVDGHAGRPVQVLAESGQHPAGGGELHHPAMAGVRHPDVPGRVDGHAAGLRQRLLSEGPGEPRRVRQRVRPW